MKRFRRLLALSPLLLLACTDSTPTAISTDDAALVSEYEEPCPACAFGPRRFRQHDDPSQMTFVPASGLAGSCTLGVRDDGRPATQARIWFNGVVVVEPGALLGPAAVARVPVTVARDSNLIAVAVRGGAGHFVTVRIVCEEPAPTARMVIVSGDNQVAAPGAALPIPPAVLVTRADGSPWAGVVVTFMVTGGGGTVTGATPTTGMDGIATVGSWTLGATPGSNALTATAADSGILGSPVTFTAASFQSDHRSLLAGWFHTCAIAQGGAPYCWGENVHGQLGDGSLTQRRSPTPVSGGLSLISLAAGDYHSCGLAAAGAVYCWGENASGQLGDGSTTRRLVPVAVTGGLRFVTLVAGGWHSCGLTGEGIAFCWGQNNWGQLGDGTSIYQSTPNPVAGDFRFRTLSAGQFHTCGVTTEGVTYCWGWNQHGQLGIGTTEYFRLLPTAVTGNLAFTTIAAGGSHVCGTAAGISYCWGHNQTGQLGAGDLVDRLAPTPVSGGPAFAALESGGWHSCAITATGTGYCWGLNAYGAVGSGPSEGVLLIPTAVAGGLTWREVVAGSFHSCGVTPAGEVYCWGNNELGQIGDGTIRNRFLPTPVFSGVQFLGGAP